jgi:hypothetical protein
MPGRKVGQGTFVAVWLRPEAAVAKNTRLDRIDGWVRWHRLGQLLEYLRAAMAGRPAFPPLALLMDLVLQN